MAITDQSETKRARKPRKSSNLTTQPKTTGRPSIHSPQLEAVFCERISMGRSLRKVCADEDMPSPPTIYLWMMHIDGFSERYARACENRAEAIFEESLEIADDSRGDFIDTENGPVFQQEHVQRARLRVDTRKWFVSKLFPKKYAEKTAVEHSGTITLSALLEEAAGMRTIGGKVIEGEKTEK